MKKGGVVEAFPLNTAMDLGTTSISFMVEPDGNVVLNCSYQNIKSGDFKTVGAIYPDKLIRTENYFEYITSRMGPWLTERGIFGHIKMDFISFELPQMGQFIWALGIKPYLDEYSCVVPFIKGVSGCHFQNDQFINIKT